LPTPIIQEYLEQTQFPQLPTNHETTTEAQVYLVYSDYYYSTNKKRGGWVVYISVVQLTPVLEVQEKNI
jgi:hypothetical protein